MLNNRFKTLICFFLLSLPCLLWGGTGKGTYRFLNLPYSAKIAGVGGENITMSADHAGQIYNNPSMFTSAMEKSLAATYVNYLSDANGGMFSFTYTKDTLNYFGVNFLFMGYGDLEGYDKSGVATGEFSAADYALNLVYARYLGAHIRVGLAMKPIYSHISSYSSVGLGFDVGMNYNNEELGLCAGFVVRNFGFRFSGYYEDQNTERLPWNMQIGISKRLMHAPFRFSVTYDHLNDWNLDCTRVADASTGEIKEINGADMFFRHVVFGVEILFSKYFHIDAGYNHRRNREYQLSEARGINGFSFGAGFKVYKFNLDAAYAQYAPSGGTFTLSLSTNIDSFKEKTARKSQKEESQTTARVLESVNSID